MVEVGLLAAAKMAAARLLLTCMEAEDNSALTTQPNWPRALGQNVPTTMVHSAKLHEVSLEELQISFTKVDEVSIDFDGLLEQLNNMERISTKAVFTQVLCSEVCMFSESPVRVKTPPKKPKGWSLCASYVVLPDAVDQAPNREAWLWAKNVQVQTQRACDMINTHMNASKTDSTIKFLETIAGRVKPLFNHYSSGLEATCAPGSSINLKVYVYDEICVYVDKALEGGLAKSVAQIKKGISKQDMALTAIKAQKCADKLDATVALDEEGRVTAKRYYNDLNALTFQSGGRICI